MQSVSAAWTAEEKDKVRQIVQSTQIAWKRFSTLTNRTFTIGVSTIGGNDVIGINPGAVGSPGNYKYLDESNYVLGLSWERGLNLPTGGLAKGLAEIRLDNTSGRFTPRYMGGNSELYTSVYKPRRPVIINAGFDLGPDITIPQFSGITTGPPQIDVRNKQLRIRAADYTDYFQNKYLDQEVMFTSQRTDQVMSTLLGRLGMNTAQYDLDYGINIVPFGLFSRGTKFADIFNDLAEAENGHFYQDETGIFKFENRQHWDSSPYNQVQKIIQTAQVIQAEAPSADHLINVVEIRSEAREKRPKELIFKLSAPLLMQPLQNTELFVNFDDPILEIESPSFWLGNTQSDGQGTDFSTNVLIKSIDKFARAAKIILYNTHPTLPLYLIDLTIYGRPAKKIKDIYYRAKDDSSVTAYQEQLHVISNDYIQNDSWAQSYAQMVLNDFSELENMQKITIRALPELQIGDLISWQGRYWRIFDVKTTLDPGSGFMQELTLLQRTINTYFRIGISTIGGSDRIAP